MLKKQIDKQQYKYYRHVISKIDEFLEYDDIKPLNILMANYNNTSSVIKLILY